MTTSSTPTPAGSPNVVSPRPRSITPRTGTPFASTRGNRRIRYDLSSVIRRRARHTQDERARRSAGSWVIGRFLIKEDRVRFEAVPELPGFVLDSRAPLTSSVTSWYRWCTRQAARQWLIRHPDPRCQPVNLQQLRGSMLEGE
jgi:hypothetical protein